MQVKSEGYMTVEETTADVSGYYCISIPKGFFFSDLKEQYPVTAHAPNFDFWTGCREIKRCEESKRILKNPFASRLAGFNTTLKLLRIIDQ